MVCSGLVSGSKKLHAKGQMFCVVEVGNVVASELSCVISVFDWAHEWHAKLQSIRPVSVYRPLVMQCFVLRTRSGAYFLPSLAMRS